MVSKGATDFDRGTTERARCNSEAVSARMRRVSSSKYCNSNSKQVHIANFEWRSTRAIWILFIGYDVFISWKWKALRTSSSKNTAKECRAIFYALGILPNPLFDKFVFTRWYLYNFYRLFYLPTYRKVLTVYVGTVRNRYWSLFIISIIDVVCFNFYWFRKLKPMFTVGR